MIWLLFACVCMSSSTGYIHKILLGTRTLMALSTAPLASSLVPCDRYTMEVESSGSAAITNSELFVICHMMFHCSAIWLAYLFFWLLSQQDQESFKCHQTTFPIGRCGLGPRLVHMQFILQTMGGASIPEIARNSSKNNCFDFDLVETHWDTAISVACIVYEVPKNL